MERGGRCASEVEEEVEDRGKDDGNYHFVFRYECAEGAIWRGSKELELVVTRELFELFIFRGGPS